MFVIFGPITGRIITAQHKETKKKNEKQQTITVFFILTEVFLLLWSKTFSQSSDK